MDCMTRVGRYLKNFVGSTCDTIYANRESLKGNRLAMIRILYQPVTNEAINDASVIIRQCYDRAQAMIDFCEARYGNHFALKHYLDIGSCYGYFLKEFSKHCFVNGIEANSGAYSVCEIFYPEIVGRVAKENFIETIDNYEPYDIVSLLSVIQEYIISDGVEFATEILQKIDAKTKDVFFMDMGQEDEISYMNYLQGWNPETIAQWILDSTTFDVVEPLMIDNDQGVGRTLFACYRNPV